ncbi:3D domain-containing protein [uncultured Vagococcus sp.]|uniref:3D domain-containing protein n=1 Tax=uncultured Vagococcus sp. TaxID=189676 RepID=UPI0028D6B276|nr:3D domain-containing protein [uncultured Vagococcus sp.]
MNLKKQVIGLVTIATIGLGMGSTAFADSIYTVKAGDTLSQLSYDYLGAADKYMTIAESNNIANADLIYVGQKLKVSADGNITPATQEEIATQPEVATVEEAAVVEAPAPVEQAAPAVEATPQGQTLTVETTAYDGVSLGGLTASGYQISSTGDKVIAVDPSVIPLGSTVYVPGYGTAIAADTGGAIQGNIIDLNMSTADAIQWGRRTVTITVLS